MKKARRQRYVSNVSTNIKRNIVNNRKIKELIKKFKINLSNDK